MLVPSHNVFFPICFFFNFVFMSLFIELLEAYWIRIGDFSFPSRFCALHLLSLMSSMSNGHLNTMKNQLTKKL